MPWVGVVFFPSPLQQEVICSVQQAFCWEGFLISVTHALALSQEAAAVSWECTILPCSACDHLQRNPLSVFLLFEFFFFFFFKLEIGSSSSITVGNQTSCSTSLVAILFFLSAAFPWMVSVFLDSVDFTDSRLDFGDNSPTPPKLKPQQRKLHSGGLWLLIGVCFLYRCCYVTGEGNQNPSATSPCTLVREAGCVCQSLERGEREREKRVCFTAPNTTASGMSQ